MKKLYSLVFYLTLLSSPLFAQTIRYVKQGGGALGSTGVDWDHASGDLQAMINASSSADQVWVAAGTYKPTEKIAATAGSRDQAFILKTGVKVYGGFLGGETLLTQRNYVANIVILSGDLNGDDVPSSDPDFAVKKADNAYHVVTADIASAGTEKSILDGFTIQGGYADGPASVSLGTLAFSQSQGAAITLRGVGAFTKLELNNLIVKDNESTGNGGAVFLNSSGTGTLLFNNVEFINNKSGASGGAIYLTRITGTGNYPSFTLNDVDFYDNKATTTGGAFYYLNTSAGVLTLNNAGFYRNSAGSTSGALYYSNSSTGKIDVYSSKFYSNNSLGGVGGAIYFPNGNSNIYNTLFYDNEASTNGGAVYVSAGTTGEPATTKIVNSTFYANSCTTGRGGAISFFGSSTLSILTLYNNIFNNNSAATAADNDIRNDNSYTGLTFKNNLFQSFTPNSATRYENNIIDAAPSLLFESTTSTDADFLKLATGSVALDKGGNSFSTALVDLANLPRIRNTTIDLGAYEFQVGDFPLPVNLETYQAVRKGSTTLLTWKTQSEQNNQKFVIERGSSATNFAFFKEVAGAGDSSTPLNYTLTDYAPLAGTNYYRLTQYDNDGKYKVLGVEAVTFELNTEKAIIYPNPARNFVEVKSPTSSGGIVSLNLISLAGKTISTNNYAQAASHESVKLDLTGIPTGTYILWINRGKSNDEKQTLLVVK